MPTPKYTPDSNSFQSHLDCLNDIAAHPGTKDKQHLLKFYLGYTSFKQLVVMMLNPYYMYGVTDFTKATPDWEIKPFGFYELMELLESLKQRQLSGNAARLATGVAVNNGVPADLMIRILNKDPKAGFGDTLVNKVCPGLIPEFPYMRCSLPEKSNMAKWDWSAGIISQIKADGMFMNVNKQGGEVTLMSRQGQIFPTEGFEFFHELVKEMLPDDTQTHGEMVVYQHGKLLDRQTGNGIINSVAQGGAWPEGVRTQFLAWDQIPMSAVKPKGKYEVIYGERFKAILGQLMVADEAKGILVLKNLFITAIPFKMVFSKKEAYEHFAEVVQAGGEGTVPKNPLMPWKDGTSKDQVKLKLDFIVDVEITGFTVGKGKFASTFGAVKYKSRCGLVKGQVSGMDDATRKRVSDSREDFIGTIMAVEANAVFMPSASNDFYSLSHPRVIEFRSMADKSVADDLSQILAQQQAAIDNAAAI